ncbi:hypothetical protein DL93DRAFT_1774900 [Clavulina sp. PMI_390]|nr:hypothetical protein DL93DRAFT_1774900 [Clavulina sp. PMI_390]
MPGPQRRSRVHKAQRDVHRAARTRAKTKDLDQIQLIDLLPENRAKLEAQPIDIDLCVFFLHGVLLYFLISLFPFLFSSSPARSHMACCDGTALHLLITTVGLSAYTIPQPLDDFPSDDRPGLGQHYCVECAKYYESDDALKSHWKSKIHKRRCKALKEPAYTQEEADRAAGLGKRETKKDVTSSSTETPIAVEG